MSVRLGHSKAIALLKLQVIKGFFASKNDAQASKDACAPVFLFTEPLMFCALNIIWDNSYL
jgi:hypothetical protein